MSGRRRFVYPSHRIPVPTDRDYAPTTCSSCGSAEVVWTDESADECECYECGTIFFVREATTVSDDTP